MTHSVYTATLAISSVVITAFGARGNKTWHHDRRSEVISLDLNPRNRAAASKALAVTLLLEGGLGNPDLWREGTLTRTQVSLLILLVLNIVHDSGLCVGSNEN